MVTLIRDDAIHLALIEHWDQIRTSIDDGDIVIGTGTGIGVHGLDPDINIDSSSDWDLDFGSGHTPTSQKLDKLD